MADQPPTGTVTIAGRKPLIVSYGGGTNSAAMLVGMRERGERPDAIVFADTGGEKPRTLGHLLVMQPWCERVGFPSITIVRGEKPSQRSDGTLEMQQIRLRSIPSRAFGYGQCSREWKIVPQERWCETTFGLGYVKVLGFHAGEVHRVLRSAAVGYTIRYFLIEWDWDDDDCRAALAREGLPDPRKSACFYCPSTRPRDILRLRRVHPRYMRRALAMEAGWLANDGGGTVKGLGRRFSWAHLLRDNDAQPDLFLGAAEECGEGCFT